MRLLRDGGDDLRYFDCDRDGDYGHWELVYFTCGIPFCWEELFFHKLLDLVGCDFVDIT